MELLSIDRNKYNFIEADDENFEYMGRIDFTNKKAPTFIYAGSMMRVKFEGTSLKIVIKNNHYSHENYIGYILDGKICGRILITQNNKRIVISILGGLNNAVHELIIFKRQDACHYFDFYGLILDKGCKLVFPGAKPKRKIECFGDSVAAGEMCECKGELNQKQFEISKVGFSNAGYSFPVMLSRYMNAELNNNAQCGLAILNDTGFFGTKKKLGLEFTYDKLRYNPELGECTKWDFNSYIPHLVIMEFGYSDYSPEDSINLNEEKKKMWKEKYKKIIRNLRAYYPKALFILITSILKHEKCWDDALDEVQEELNDPKVVRYKFIRNGSAASQYLTVPNQAEMAQELSIFVNSFGEEIWR